MVLVALDIEGCAAEVVAVAGQLALDLGEDMELLTATAVPDGVPDVQVLPGHQLTVHDEVALEARGVMQALARPWAERGVGVRYTVTFGRPHDVILDRIAQVRPRMLVMGTHARTGIRRLLFGSVEESVVRDVDIPVVVVPSRDTPVHPAATLSALRVEADG